MTRHAATLLLICGVGPAAALFEGIFGSGDAEPVSHLNVDDSTVTVGQEHACALIVSSVNSRFGAPVSCWGANSHGELDHIPSDMFVQLSAGRYFTCGITDAMALLCWGAIPTPLAAARSQYAGQKFTQVSVGTNHLCTVRNNGSIACYGDDSWRQLRDAPAAPPKALQVSCGGDSCCGVATNGSLLCWGGSHAARAMVSAPPCGAYAQVSVGLAGTACAITAADHDMHCWGTILGAPLPQAAPRGPQVLPEAGADAASFSSSDGSSSESGGGVISEAVADGSEASAAPPVDSSPAAPQPVAYAPSLSSAQASTVETDAAACSGSRPPHRLLRRPGPYTQVTAGRTFVCGLRADGSPDCFGDTSRLWSGRAAHHRVAVTDAATGRVAMRRAAVAGLPAGAVVLEVSSHHDALCAVFAFATASDAEAPVAVMDCWGQGGSLAPPPGLRPALM